MWSLETSPEHSWNQRNCVDKGANFSFVNHLAAFRVCTLSHSWKYVYRCMVCLTVRRGGSWKFLISFGTSVGNLVLWMSASSYSLIRIPRFWQGYCVYTWMICCWVAVVQPIVKQSMHCVHVCRFANGKETRRILWQPHFSGCSHQRDHCVSEHLRIENQQGDCSSTSPARGQGNDSRNQKSSGL